MQKMLNKSDINVLANTSVFIAQIYQMYLFTFLDFSAS